MTQKDTWFDAFFQAVTTSPEFKKVATKDWSWDMQLKKQKPVKKTPEKYQ